MSEYRWASFILSASPKSFFPLIVQAQSSAGRQPPEVWQAFKKLVIPHSTREFVRDSLWLKLKVGDILKGWLPHQRMCPLCQEVETVAHALYGCKFLRLSIDTILGCYGDLSQPPYTGPFCMSLTQHSVTLTIPHGIFVVVSQTCKLESALLAATRYHSAYNTHICDCMVWFVAPLGVFQGFECPEVRTG